MSEAEIIEKLLNDATWGIQTHFNAQQDEIDALKRKIELQTKLFKELWGKVKRLEQEGLFHGEATRDK